MSNNGNGGHALATAYEELANKALDDVARLEKTCYQLQDIIDAQLEQLSTMGEALGRQRQVLALAMQAIQQIMDDERECSYICTPEAAHTIGLLYGKIYDEVR